MGVGSSKEEVLEGLGFSRNEAKTYIALLNLGMSGPTEISRKAGLHRTNVYDALAGLVEKGFGTFIYKGGTKYFEATPPEALLSLVKDKEFIVQAILRQLDAGRSQGVQKTEVFIHEGLAAAKDILNHFLDMGADRVVFGSPRVAYEKLHSFLEGYHKRRVVMKIGLREVYNTDAKDRASQLNVLPYTEVRLLPREYNSPVATTVCGDETAFFIWGESVLIIHIKNPEIAKTYRNYFELLWGIAKR